MIFVRTGKCTGCGKPCREEKEILITIDMFDPTPKTYLKGPVLHELRAWRKTKLYCDRAACKPSVSQLK